MVIILVVQPSKVIALLILSLASLSFGQQENPIHNNVGSDGSDLKLDAGIGGNIYASPLGKACPFFTGAEGIVECGKQGFTASVGYLINSGASLSYRGIEGSVGVEFSDFKLAGGGMFTQQSGSVTPARDRYVFLTVAGKGSGRLFLQPKLKLLLPISGNYYRTPMWGDPRPVEIHRRYNISYLMIVLGISVGIRVF